MTATLLIGLLWVCALGCGLTAGVYFAFSTFVMRALGSIAATAGIAAMNAINTVILRSWFMPLFVGTTIISLLLAVSGCIRWGRPGSVALLLGGVLYVVAMFLSTLVFNVPLNQALAGVDPSSPAGAQTWAQYVTDWTLWNHVRAIASAASMGLFVHALTVLKANP